MALRIIDEKYSTDWDLPAGKTYTLTLTGAEITALKEALVWEYLGRKGELDDFDASGSHELANYALIWANDTVRLLNRLTAQAYRQEMPSFGTPAADSGGYPFYGGRSF